MLFCLLRMQQIVFLKEHTDKQTDDIKLEFSEEIDAITKAFLSRKRNYYQNSLRNIFQRFILLDTLAYVLLLMIFVLLFHIPFKVAFILLVLAWIVVLVYAKQKGVPYFLWFAYSNAFTRGGFNIFTSGSRYFYKKSSNRLFFTSSFVILVKYITNVLLLSHGVI